MGKRPGKTDSQTTPEGASGPPEPVAPAASRRDQLADLLTRCAAAQTSAEALGERLLSYLLAMAAAEARSALERLGEPTEDPAG